jgi:hypothetical protein
MATIVDKRSNAAKDPMQAALAELRNRLSLATVRDSLSASRYAVSSVDQGGAPSLVGAQVTPGTSGLPKPSSVIGTAPVAVTQSGSQFDVSLSASGVIAGTYGDATHVGKFTVDALGRITAASNVAFTSGGGSPVAVKTVTAPYTVAAADVPTASASRGAIVADSSATTDVTIDAFANTAIPVGAEITFVQQGTGALTITSASTVNLIGAAITGAGQGAVGRALQIAQDLWVIDGALAWVNGGAGDPYWSNVLSLLWFTGAAGSSTFTDQVSGSSWTDYGAPVISSSQAKFGTTSGYFNGSSAISLNKQAAIGTGDFTVDLWVYPTVTPSTSTIFCGQQDVSTQTVFQIRGSSGGALEVLLRPNGGGSVTTVDGATSISLNVWHLLSVSRVSGTVYTFLDGALQGSAAFAGSLNCSAHVFTYGGLNDGSGGGSFTGLATCYFGGNRITVGVGRYTASFTPPAAPFPNHA